MTTTTRLVVLYLVLAVALMCLVLVLHLKPSDEDHHHHVSSADCRIGYGCIRTETPTSSTTLIRSSRKLLLHDNAAEVFKSFGPVLLDHLQQQQQQQQQGHDGGGNVDDDGWSLRAVPSGPDPLHHNGSGPKKPQTP